MKRTRGIIRDKLNILSSSKADNERKKNRFKYAGKDEELEQTTITGHALSLLSATTQNSSSSVENIENHHTQEVYDQAKNLLLKVFELRKKMATEIKLRLSAYKESDIAAYDENICKFSKKAVEHILNSEKLLGTIRSLHSSNEIEQKFYRNMEKSLAQQIRTTSKDLRSQQKQYFDRLRTYESDTANLAIQLNKQEQLKMKDEFQQVYEEKGELTERNKQINELVKSINQLSSVYKELNQLVIEQGSLIDRIDFNIDETLVHMEKGNDHLRSAEKKASSSCAQKCIIILITLIFCMALVVGFKMASNNPGQSQPPPSN